VKKALGDSAFREYRGKLENLDPLAGQIAGYNQYADLKAGEVLATWEEEPPKEHSDRSLEDNRFACLLPLTRRCRPGFPAANLSVGLTVRVIVAPVALATAVLRRKLRSLIEFVLQLPFESHKV
jgi:hypothetical protein